VRRLTRGPLPPAVAGAVIVLLTFTRLGRKTRQRASRGDRLADDVWQDSAVTRSDAKFSEGNRPVFAFASYNCGPANVFQVTQGAAKRGLDPDKWFNNVELVVAEKIGTETTTYVRNIYKYYVAYRLTLDAQAESRKARQQVVPVKS